MIAIRIAIMISAIVDATRVVMTSIATIVMRTMIAMIDLVTGGDRIARMITIGVMGIGTTTIPTDKMGIIAIARDRGGWVGCSVLKDRFD